MTPEEQEAQELAIQEMIEEGVDINDLGFQY